MSGQEGEPWTTVGVQLGHHSALQDWLDRRKRRETPPPPPPLPPRRIETVSTSISIPRTLYNAIAQVQKRTGETRSAILTRTCMGALADELSERIEHEERAKAGVAAP